jgi:hypothetical protein
MKLYATITSERATKGQGGNNLETTITDKDKNILIRMETHTRDERRSDSRLKYFSEIIDGDEAFLINLRSNISFYLDKTKGKR